MAIIGNIPHFQTYPFWIFNCNQSYLGRPCSALHLLIPSLCAVFVDAPRSWWWLCRSGMHGVHIDPKKTRLWKIKIFIGSFAGRLNQESFHHEISWGCPQRETQHSKLNTRTNTSSHVISFFCDAKLSMASIRLRGKSNFGATPYIGGAQERP